VPDSFLPDAAWSAIQGELRQSVSESTWRLWLEPLRPRALDGDTLVLGAPDAIRSWVADRFSRVLQTAAAAVLGPQTTVSVVPLDGPVPAGRASEAPDPHGPGEAAAAAAGALNPKYTFEQFVIGDANRLAHAAALAVAELPGQAYNPLFIYGSPGLGKTHLLHAIANYLVAHGTGLTVRYVTVESFTNHFVHSLQAGSTERFKARYRDVDVLLVDDIQFLRSKARTEEEFFHTFNALYEAGSQLVMTCDRLPRDLDALEDRLRERFESGLVTDIHPPDLDTRMTILRKRVAYDDIELADPSALEVLASRITTNIRALEGALIRLVAFHSLTRRPIDGDLAREVVDALYPGSRPARRSVIDVQRATCETFGLDLAELLSGTRATRVAWPRQVAMYLARELTDETLPAIGRDFGGRNHTTVMHACRRTASRMKSDREAFDTIQSITRRLQDAG
jgi:chromosomal replication initiator protein